MAKTSSDSTDNASDSVSVPATSSTTGTSTSTKSWLTRSIATMMQLPRSTPLAALRWTDPEGPFPKIIHLPSRDVHRTVEIYVWVPSKSMPTSQAHSQSSAPPIKPSFTSSHRPCLIDFHGGGFIMGSPLEQAPWCSALARSGIVSISVAYRLGPTHEFPAALLDAEDTIQAVLQSSSEAGKALRNAIGPDLDIDTNKVALSGFSSGGNVALNMLLNLQGASLDSSGSDWPSPFGPERRPLIPALLFFPSLDARQAPYERSRPEKMGPPGYLSGFIGRNLRNAYLPADKLAHPRASPGLAPIFSLHRASRMLLILPEIDTLAEQSEVWVKKLDEAGVIIQHEDDGMGKNIGVPIDEDKNCIRVHRIKEMSHGFTTFPDAFIDEPTRKVKAIVMEQARRWIISMFGGNPGDDLESIKRVEASALEGGPQSAPKINPPKLS